MGASGGYEHPKIPTTVEPLLLHVYITIEIL